MSEIKLNRELFESEKTGIALDQDDSGLFYRLTLRVAHPVTKDSAYMEYNKEDSKSLLIQKEDGIYVKEEDVSYLKESWQANEYENRLAAIAWKPAVRDVDVPAYWYDTTVQIIPQKTAMYDEVFVNEEIVKIDYAVGCTGKLKTEYEELINKIKEKFPNEHDFLSNENNIIGKYNDNHTIRPPYKSQNTMTVYHMYYDKDIFNQFLKDYKIPEHDYAYRFWFGLKYDLDSGVRYLKVVIGDDDKTSNYQKYPSSFIPRPQLPICTTPYFAKIYSPDGTEADEYDVFFSTTPQIMKAYCTKNGLNFPIPESREGDYIWTYGLVYDKNTLDIKQVKGYIKVPQNISDWLW